MAFARKIVEGISKYNNAIFAANKD